MEIATQGTTSSASTARLTLQDVDDFENVQDALRHFAVRVLAADLTGYTGATNATIALATRKGVQVTEHTANKDYTWRSYPGQKAVHTLTIGGVVTDGEYVTLGSGASARIYEFDTNNSVTAGRVRVNVASYATAAQGTLTLALQPAEGQSFTIDSKSYVFVPAGTATGAGQIPLGTDLAATKPLVVAAINGTDGINSAHPTVSAAAFSSDACVITARVPGVGGNSIVFTEALAGTGNEMDGSGVLGGTTAGVSCTAANAVTALAAAINTDTLATFSAADGTGDTVVVTADNVGDAGNITTAESTANCTWANTTTGYDANPGVIEIDFANTTAETARIMLLPAVAPCAAVVDWSSHIKEITHAA